VDDNDTSRRGNMRYRLCYDTVVDRHTGARRKGSQELHDPYDKALALDVAAHMNALWGIGHWVEDEDGERVEGSNDGQPD